MKYFLTRFLLPMALFVGGIACAGLLVVLGPRTTPDEGRREALLVDVVRIDPVDMPAVLEGTGVVEPDQRVDLVPEVAGRITWIADDLRPGGRFAKGAVLARIDARDYEAAVASERARFKQAEVELALEQERRSSSARQWELLGDGRGEEQAKLALRKPHLELAQANVAGSQASLERAQRNLQRTRLSAPFNAVVLSESLDVGQTVGGAPVATLAGTDRFRVPVNVSVDELAMLDIPGVNATVGSDAILVQPLGGGHIEYRAQISGLQGQLDPQTRTAVLLVTVEDPLRQGSDELPLLPGAFVEVILIGRIQPGALPVPRHALYDGTVVWTVVDDKLHRNEVTVAFESDGLAFVSSGLLPGAVVVTSRLGTPLEGQEVRTEEPAPAVGALADEE